MVAEDLPSVLPHVGNLAGDEYILPAFGEFINQLQFQPGNYAGQLNKQ